MTPMEMLDTYPAHRTDTRDVDRAAISGFFDDIGTLTALPLPADIPAAMAAFFDAIESLKITGPTKPAKGSPGLTASDLMTFLTDMAELPANRQPTPTFNIWSVAGTGRNEVRNTSILAWALNPRGSHGQGPSVLNALMDIARRKSSATEDLFPFPPEVSRCSIRTEASPFSDQANRVDILADGPDFTAFIEVKIDAAPDPDQIRRYLRLSEARAAATGRSRYGVIFLAPHWARDLPYLGPRVATVTWRDVADAIAACIPPESEGQSADAALQQFTTHIRDF
jgi:hypothetical protein